MIFNSSHCSVAVSRLHTDTLLSYPRMLKSTGEVLLSLLVFV